MRTLGAVSANPWVRAEFDAVERGQVVADSDADVLVAYGRGECKWALVTVRHVICGAEADLRRLL